MKKAEVKFCGSCKFWNCTDEPTDDNPNPEGECRRYAPRILSGSGAGWSDTLYPPTAMMDWCGEHEEGLL